MARVVTVLIIALQCVLTAALKKVDEEDDDDFAKELQKEMADAVGKYGYKLEGTLGFCFSNPTTGTIPLHRYYSKPHIDHFYTTKFQKSYGGNSEWKYEGIQCYVYPA